MPAPDLEKMQAQIEEMRAFIGPEGLRAGQERVRANYTETLENEVADSLLVMADDIDDEEREVVLAAKTKLMTKVHHRIASLDRTLGPPEKNGNRHVRRRRAKRQPRTKRQPRAKR